MFRSWGILTSRRGAGTRTPQRMQEAKKPNSLTRKGPEVAAHPTSFKYVFIIGGLALSARQSHAKAGHVITFALGVA